MAFHLQTDSQMEHLNQTIESYLWVFVEQEQDDWVTLLPIAVFVYNNSVMRGNRMSLFYAN